MTRKWGILLLLIIMLVMSACTKKTYIEYTPKGYGFVNHELIGEASFTFTTKYPGLLNAFTISVYYLPEYWGEIKVSNIEQFDPYDPSFLILPSNRVYVRYIYVDSMILEAREETFRVYYYTEDGERMLDYLEEESHARSYVLALRASDAYLLDHEKVMLTTHTMRTVSSQSPNGLSYGSSQMILYFYDVSNYTEKDTIPDFSNMFAYGDSALMNALFMRVYENRFNPEFKVYEWTE